MSGTPRVPIGVFDSGSGGLSVWRDMVSLLPFESLIYLGDHRYLPYSVRSGTFIRRRVISAIRFFRMHSVKLVVVACNTATVAGIDRYREAFPGLPIIGVVPVVKTAVSRTGTGHIAVFSTSYTARSRYQDWLIKTYASGVHVENIGSPDLVTRIESGDRSSPALKRELRRLLEPVGRTDADVLALGCTHYPFLRDEIRAIVGERVALLDSGGAVARHVARVLENNGIRRLSGKPTYSFHTTGDARQVSRVAGMLLERPTRFVHTDLPD